MPRPSARSASGGASSTSWSTPIATEEDVEAAPQGPSLSNDEIMAKVEDLHRRYDDGQMDLESFDEQRATLMAQISVD